MSEFGGLWQHKHTQHAPYASKIINLMIVVAQRKEEEGERGGGKRDDSAEIIYQSFLPEAFVSSSGIGRDVHSLVLSILHFL